MASHTLGDSHFFTLKDGRKLHYRMQGEGSPTVVFESGMGFSGSYWGMIQPEVSRRTTAVTYDRAGTGASDRDTHERSLERIADDLGQLLDHLPGPFILVGHSWGGPIVRTLASRRSADILGLVLVDQVDERDPEYFTRVRDQKTGMAHKATRLIKHVVGFRWAAIRMLKDMPEDTRREVLQGDLSRQGLQTGESEFEHFIPGLEMLSENPCIFPGTHVTVITGTDPDGMSKGYRRWLVNAHRKTADAVEMGSLVEAPKSGHYIQLTEPDVVIREVNQMVELIRSSEPEREKTVRAVTV